jgi:hypothetical protein
MKRNANAAKLLKLLLQRRSQGRSNLQVKLHHLRKKRRKR